MRYMRYVHLSPYLRCIHALHALYMCTSHHVRLEPKLLHPARKKERTATQPCSPAATHDHNDAFVAIQGYSGHTTGLPQPYSCSPALASPVAPLPFCLHRRRDPDRLQPSPRPLDTIEKHNPESVIHQSTVPEAALPFLERAIPARNPMHDAEQKVFPDRPEPLRRRSHLHVLSPPSSSRPRPASRQQQTVRRRPRA